MTRNALPRPKSASERGPVVLAMELTFGLLFMTLFSWGIGILIEVVGGYTLWEDQQEMHVQSLVREDLEHIASAPRSVLVDDTPAFAKWVVQSVAAPYHTLGLVRWYREQRALEAADAQSPEAAPRKGLAAASRLLSYELSRIAIISMHVLQDVLLKLSIALFALPAFALACLLGAVDGLVRRDLRRWGGGRESSFVYHHSKKLTTWSLTGGFVLYLSWPFGGFNPAYMVLVFTVLVGATLSTTLSAFKKYV